MDHLRLANQFFKCIPEFYFRMKLNPARCIEIFNNNYCAWEIRDEKNRFELRNKREMIHFLHDYPKPRGDILFFSVDIISQTKLQEITLSISGTNSSRSFEFFDVVTVCLVGEEYKIKLLTSKFFYEKLVGPNVPAFPFNHFKQEVCNLFLAVGHLMQQPESLMTPNQ